MGLPINTALAPNANAFNTSVPCLIPPSTYTSTLPLTSFTISERASIYSCQQNKEIHDVFHNELKALQ